MAGRKRNDSDKCQICRVLSAKTTSTGFNGWTLLMVQIDDEKSVFAEQGD